jgi:hypothetical protein
MEYQLRIYDMKPGALDEFVEFFPRVVELRRRVGFTIEGAWVEREANRFVWIAGYGGDDGFRAAERRYYTLPEREGLEPNPLEFIEHYETTMLESVPVD